VDNWYEAGRDFGMSDDELEPFADAFEHSERAAAKKAI
jgi:serine/threonine-protein kinase HipA